MGNLGFKDEVFIRLWVDFWECMDGMGGNSVSVRDRVKKVASGVQVFYGIAYT